MGLAYLMHDANEASQSGVSFSESTENSAHPSTNVGVLPVTKAWRTTDVTDEYIELDLGSAKSIDFLGLIGNNLSSGATITLKGGTTANPSDFTEVITWREFDAMEVLASTQSYRHWRIRLQDAGNSDGYLEVGYIVLGLLIRPGITPDFGFEFVDDYVNREIETELGAMNVKELYYQVRIRMSFSNRQDTIADLIRTWFRAARGSLIPFMFLPDVSIDDGHFGRFKVPLVRQWSTRNPSGLVQSSGPLIFVEESRGDRVGV